jgi:hypothetical protein
VVTLLTLKESQDYCKSRCMESYLDIMNRFDQMNLFESLRDF